LFSGECFLRKSFSGSGDSEGTIHFLKQLLVTYPNQQHIILWDGASNHCSHVVRDFLTEVNHGLEEKEWRIHCVRFAPNAPKQNPIEDVWLQAKNHVRKHFDLVKVFSNATGLFEQFLSKEVFNFPKLKMYFSANFSN